MKPPSGSTAYSGLQKSFFWFAGGALAPAIEPVIMRNSAPVPRFMTARELLDVCSPLCPKPWWEAPFYFYIYACHIYGNTKLFDLFSPPSLVQVSSPPKAIVITGKARLVETGLLCSFLDSANIRGVCILS